MTENENNFQNNTPQPGQETQNAQQKSVQDNIASVVQQYSSFKDQVAGVQKVKQPKEKKAKKKRRIFRIFSFCYYPCFPFYCFMHSCFLYCTA